MSNIKFVQPSSNFAHSLTKLNKLEHVQATKRDPNFSKIKFDYRKK
jgi:hypothetical protein